MPSRRCFIKAGLLTGASFWTAFPAGVRRLALPEAGAIAPSRQASGGRVVRLGCPSHNCGGRCLLKVHLENGVITRIETDDRTGDGVDTPQLRACARGRAYRKRQHHPDRLLHPLRRVGPRGEGKFERISWDAALDRVAAELTRVRAGHGNASLFIPYGTGSYSQTNGRQTAVRLLNLFGGSLGHYNNYSWAAMARATETVYGTTITGNQRQDWLNAKYILMWGWNPCEARDGTNTEFYLRKARDAGARIVCIDPRMTPSAVALADEWIPIRPGTDAALLSAMAHVLLTEKLYDEPFVRTHCVGFDASQMPPGAKGAESYEDYLLGARDRTPKTPAWAEPITGVPRETIARIAREYGTRKPGVLYQGYGVQRRAYGEQAVRAACVLAAIAGNVGVPGGWAGGLGLQAPDGGPLWNVFPTGINPVKASIPAFLWTEAVTRGRQLGAAQGVRGVDRLEGDIKLIYAVASNALLNQHANINRTAAILRDERLAEFIVVQDNFLTPSARFADLVLPACTQLETWGVEDGWKYGEEVLLMPPVEEPPGEAKSDFAICAGIAGRLKIGDAYTEGRDERGWVAWAIDRFRKARYPGLPHLEAFEQGNAGVHVERVVRPAVAFAAFRQDPVKNPLPTPSGRIEIFSPALHALGQPTEIPAVPKYIEEWESPFGAVAKKYPLQVVGFHSLARVHSTMAGVEWLEEAFPQRLCINPIDAAARGITDGDEVRVFNDRGETRLRCRVTSRILPGVVAMPQGAWWQPDAQGIDHGGSVNVLTSERWTALAFGNAQHSVMAEVALPSASPRMQRDSLPPATDH
ncbi:MAG TPA: DMSO/selenate family reductase complex A subunit [Vicinamibacterales bacterium]|nr:DMSO/selenate family reductase complex A subunit [Vicinamibacterales bacterium]